MSMTPADQALWEKHYQTQMQGPQEPKLKVRAKTQIVVEGVIRYMAEEFELPERFALGLIGEGEAEQVIEENRPYDWAQNAPGPYEGDRGGELNEPVLGSREPPRQMGQQHTRQQTGAEAATTGQPQQDTTRQRGEPGGSVKPAGPAPQRQPRKIPPSLQYPPQYQPPHQHQPQQRQPQQQQQHQPQSPWGGGQGQPRALGEIVRQQQQQHQPPQHQAPKQHQQQQHQPPQQQHQKR